MAVQCLLVKAQTWVFTTRDDCGLMHRWWAVLLSFRLSVVLSFLCFRFSHVQSALSSPLSSPTHQDFVQQQLLLNHQKQRCYEIRTMEPSPHPMDTVVQGDKSSVQTGLHVNQRTFKHTPLPHSMKDDQCGMFLVSEFWSHATMMERCKFSHTGRDDSKQFIVFINILSLDRVTGHNRLGVDRTGLWKTKTTLRQLLCNCSNNLKCYDTASSD